jgi:hypothetical protein
MKANELRIGNYILLQGVTKPTQVSIIDTTEQSTRTKASPIPLTEEWLLKFGFVKKKGESGYSKGKLLIYFGLTTMSGVNGRTYFNSWAILYKSPEYVHQLQNLYFALTGEELTYEREKQ